MFLSTAEANHSHSTVDADDGNGIQHGINEHQQSKANKVLNYEKQERRKNTNFYFHQMFAIRNFWSVSHAGQRNNFNKRHHTRVVIHPDTITASVEACI